VDRVAPDKIGTLADLPLDSQPGALAGGEDMSSRKRPGNPKDQSPKDPADPAPHEVNQPEPDDAKHLATLARFLHEANELATEVIAENQPVCDELGILKGVPADIADLLNTYIQDLAARNDGRPRTDALARIRALVRLRYAITINTGLRSLESALDSGKTHFNARTMMITHLLGLWHGLLLATEWIDKDDILKLMKKLHHQELQSEYRSRREPRQDEILDQLAGKIARKRKHDPRKPLMKCIKEVLAAEGYDKATGKTGKRSITPEKLLLKVMEPRFQETVATADKLWAEGDARSHPAMTDYLISTLQLNLDRKLKTIVRNELIRRIKEIAVEKYRNRVFGLPGVRKNE
jgi:hypothetical protein